MMETTTETIGVDEGTAAPAKRVYTKRSAYWLNPKKSRGHIAAEAAPPKAKKSASRAPVLFRQGSWEVKRGNGLWKTKYTRDMTEDQVRQSLALEFPGASITHYYVRKNGNGK